MKKKITSLVFAAALCLSFCVPAFAAEEGSGEQVYDRGSEP